MKKLYKQNKYKRYNQQHSQKQLSKKIRFKNYKKRKNISGHGHYEYEGLPVKEGYHEFVGPENFSLIDNPNEVISFIHEAEKVFRQRCKIRFNLQQIKSLTPEAIAFFIAHLKSNKFTHYQHYRGVNPRKPKLAKMFDESSFYDYVQSSRSTPKTCSSKSIHRVSEYKVEPKIAKDFSKTAVDFSLSEGLQFRPLYEIIIECMANTKNHAAPDNDGKYNWWMFIYCDENTQISHFTFIDLGVGIFESINISLYRKISQLFDSDSNPQIMKDILNGKYQSRTKKKERGKGFPLIQKHSMHDNIKNMKMISNNVFADVEKINCKRLKHDFHGTLLYWEVHPDRIGEQLELW